MLFLLEGMYYRHLGFPKTGTDALHREVLREISDDINTLFVYVNENERRLLLDKKRASNTFVDSVGFSKGVIFFRDAPGATGKILVTKLLLDKVRQLKDMTLAVASSGITATLLSDGRNEHSTFKLPMDIASSDNPIFCLSKSLHFPKCQKGAGYSYGMKLPCHTGQF